MSTTVDLRDGARAEMLRTSARGWHGVQLAVLGFIGLCGALHEAGDVPGPSWLQPLAAVLVLLALVLACVATVLVAAQAWPVGDGTGSPDARVRHTVGHLRLGIALTFVAVAMAALATSSSWWPVDAADEDLVTVSTGQGTVCGRLLDSAGGSLLVEVSGQQLSVPLDQVSALSPVGSC